MKTVTVNVDELVDFGQQETMAVWAALRREGAVDYGTINIDELKDCARRWFGPTVEVPAELVEVSDE